jgi:zinc protease
MQKIARFQLKNGLCGIVLQRPRAGSRREGAPDLIGVRLYIAAGSSSDPSGRKGTAHVVEHLVSRTVSERHSLLPPKLRRLQPKGGLTLSPSETDLDFTRYGLVTLLGAHPAAFAHLRKWLASTSLNEALARRCVEEVIHEKRVKEAESPFGRLYEPLYAQAFGSHPYASYTLGNADHLREISAADCREFLERHYVPRNALLSVAILGGGKGTLEAVVQSVEKSLEGSAFVAPRKRSVWSTQPQPMPPYRPRYRIPVPVRAVVAGFRCPPYRECHLRALLVLNQLLTGPASRFRRRIRSGLLGICGVLPVTRQEGLFEVLLLIQERPRATGAREIKEALLEECFRLAEGKFSPRDLELARDVAAKDFSDGCSVAATLAESAAAIELFGEGWSGFDREERQIRDQTVETVTRFAKRVLVPERLTLTHGTWQPPERE